MDSFDMYDYEPETINEGNEEPASEPVAEEGNVEATPEPELKPEPEKRVAELEAELAAARADFYNYRQRMTRERQETRRRAEEDTITALLPVLDNLDRALAVSEDGSAKDILTGVKMVQKQFLTSLGDLGVSVIPTEGQRFDPSLHEAAGTAPVEDPEQDGMVVGEQLRGYRTTARVLRPARVTVGKLEE